jgi:hypothetical protein
MGSVPIVVHRPSPSGGCRVTVRGKILGLAHGDQELIKFLRHAGLPDAELHLDDPHWVEGRGGRAHQHETA